FRRVLFRSNYLLGAAAQAIRDDAPTGQATKPAPSPASNISATVFGDADDDGVTDALDHCPGTEAGTPVDEHGCENDSDRDGINNSIDQCPNTPSEIGRASCRERA